jgi:hypothetical protein
MGIPKWFAPASQLLCGKSLTVLLEIILCRIQLNAHFVYEY